MRGAERPVGGCEGARYVGERELQGERRLEKNGLLSLLGRGVCFFGFMATPDLTPEIS